ncbi:alpha/beta hydrolase [Actinophytocola oryzae]|uniref:Serine aminopeptidase S33 domain-containing protein n=1 Tax=Actinophytocola oryzae TaxID=502181 RepID=A0A4V3FSL3_9PSEU|nr:alpha/beta fold hydrolase [Actinophytocola oryzae]TDV47951.1 hypothetical protein CLV71_109186 [Actinophytocola oryzae]
MVDGAAAALALVGLARDGRFGEVAELFSAPLRALASEGTVRSAWVAELGRIGAVTAIGIPATGPGEAGLVRASVPVTCERGGFTVLVSFDDRGIVHGLRLAPATGPVWTPPDYVRRRRFTEREMVLGGGPRAVPGTLTLPRRARVGVVLLSGGGPFDRDGTSGANKPLKDVAWGLASRGVAVLRFDKVTHVHGGLAPGATMTDEYVPHAVAAVELLRAHVERVVLVGHSMGGKAAPLVASSVQVDGMVLLAGDAQPMHHAAVRVARYLASVAPDVVDGEAVAVFTRQAALVDGPDLTPSTPAAELPFGFPASWWLAMRAYDPVAAAAAVGVPMLILQGARDYQVTVTDDLTRWQAGLAHRPNVTFRVYAGDNHLFFPGEGPSTPAEYDQPQHVDPQVVTDIATWLSTTRPVGQAGRRAVSST